MEQPCFVHVAVVFDTPYPDYSQDDHLDRMEEELRRGRKVEAEMEYQVAGALRNKGHKVSLVGVHDDPASSMAQLRESAVDMVFNASEGFQQVDTLDFLLPALFEAGGHRYTGAPPMGLMVTRNKAMSKKILAHHGIKTPRFLTFRRGDKVPKNPDLSFPAIVKPQLTDASAGISLASIVRDVPALVDRVQFVHDKFGGPAIVEEFIEGRELYASVLGNDKRLEMLPLVELVFDKTRTKPEERIATSAAKWDEPYRKRNGIRSVFARPLSKAARERIEETARTAYRALWLRDYARFDIRLDDDDNVWVLEANANPYLCRGHEFSEAAKKAGIPYSDLVDRIVRDAHARYRND